MVHLLAAGQMLADHGIQATAFVCPGVLDTSQRLWFQKWGRSAELGLIPDADSDRFSSARLKSLPDDELRAEVRVLEERLNDVADHPPEQATQAMLQGWIEQGHDIGNHTWDHPMLDRCSTEVQKSQVSQAHDALIDRGFTSIFLAYPNGNWSPGAARQAEELGYAGCLLFDHSLPNLAGDRNRLSRLRIDSDVTPRRALGIASGAHSAAFGALTRRPAIGVSRYA